MWAIRCSAAGLYFVPLKHRGVIVTVGAVALGLQDWCRKGRFSYRSPASRGSALTSQALIMRFGTL